MMSDKGKFAFFKWINSLYEIWTNFDEFISVVLIHICVILEIITEVNFDAKYFISLLRSVYQMSIKEMKYNILNLVQYSHLYRPIFELSLIAAVLCLIIVNANLRKIYFFLYLYPNITGISTERLSFWRSNQTSSRHTCLG